MCQALHHLRYYYFQSNDRLNAKVNWPELTTVSVNGNNVLRLFVIACTRYNYFRFSGCRLARVSRASQCMSAISEFLINWAKFSYICSNFASIRHIACNREFQCSIMMLISGGQYMALPVRDEMLTHLHVSSDPLPSPEQ